MRLSSEEQFDLLSQLAVLRRQLRLIALTVIAILAGAFLYLVRTPPLYSATALVKIDPQEINLLEPGDGGSMSSAIETTRIETEAEVLRSNQMALQTIARLELQTTAEFGPRLGLAEKFRTAIGLPPPGPSQPEYLANRTLQKFLDSLQVKRKGLTYIVSIRFTSRDPHMSANVANAHARGYIQAQVSSRASSALAARDVLQAQLNQARGQLTRSIGSMQLYVDNNLERLLNETGSDTLSALSGELKETTLALRDREELLTLARLNARKEDWSSLAGTIGNSALATLEEERQLLLARLNSTDKGSDEAFDLAAGLAELDGALKEQGSASVEQLRQEVARISGNRASLLDAVQNEALQGQLSGTTLTEIYELRQEAQIAQRQYDTLIARMRDIEAQAVLQVASSQLVSEAIVPSEPSFPDRNLTFSMAAAGALAIGIGAAFLKEYYFGGVTSASQLANVVPVKVGAVVPRMGVPPIQETLADRVIQDPMAHYAEAFRKLRASIDQSIHPAKNGGKILLVTSAIPEEGKSTAAFSLARTYANAGKKTLLIDADLRRPSLHKLLGESPKCGLMDFLVSEGEADGNPSGAVRPDRRFNHNLVGEFYVLDPLSSLAMILGNRRANIPTDALLQGKAFHELIAEARGAFDVVVVDSAPLLPVVDPQYIAPLADAAVLCVRFGQASQMDLRTACSHLSDSLAPAAPVIAVLNALETSRQDYRYAYY